MCAGDGVRGGGCCANLPVFFSQNSGLVAVVARESVSILPETMEDSLCSSLAAAPEVEQQMETPHRGAKGRHTNEPSKCISDFLKGFCHGDSDQSRARSSGGQNQTPESRFPAVLSVRLEPDKALNVW